jgi:hypothetical protein
MAYSSLVPFDGEHGSDFATPAQSESPLESVGPSVQYHDVPTLTTLPQEVREMIWELAMSDLPTRFYFSASIHLNKTTFFPKTLPQFAFVSHAMQTEVIPVWLRRTRFAFDENNPNYDAMYHDFLDYIGAVPRGFESVRMVMFNNVDHIYNSPNCSWCPTGVTNCLPALASIVFITTGLCFTESSASGIKRKRNAWARDLKNTERLRELWQLEDLVSHSNVKSLKFGIKVHAWMEADVEEAKDERFVGNFKDLLMQHYEQQNKAIDVRVTIKHERVREKMVWVECVPKRKGN